jgi:hypothetical protein
MSARQTLIVASTPATVVCAFAVANMPLSLWKKNHYTMGISEGDVHDSQERATNCTVETHTTFDVPK